MRLPTITILQLMVGTAAIAFWLAVVRWDAVLQLTCAAALTYIPAFLWAADGGMLPIRDVPRSTSKGRADHFLWAWFISTACLAAVIHLVCVWTDPRGN